MTAPIAAYWHAQDASSDPRAFPSFMVGALSAFVDAATWERALEVARECDLTMAGGGVS